MKFTTLKYDANRPSPKQVTVPTDSDFAVGVKVWKDGQEVQSPPLSVGGTAAEQGRGGWAVAKLSADGAEGLRELGVEVDKAATQKWSAETVLTGQNIIPLESGVAFSYALSDDVEPGTEIVLDWLKAPQARAVVSSAAGVVTKDVFDFKSPYARIYFNGSADAMNFVNWNPATGEWAKGGAVSGDAAVATENAQFKVSFKMPGQSVASCDMRVGGDSGDECKTKFRLFVQQKDMGYVETEDAPAPAPTGDPALITDGTYSISADGSCVYLSSDYAWHTSSFGDTHDLTGSRDDASWNDGDVKWRIWWEWLDEDLGEWHFETYAWDVDDWTFVDGYTDQDHDHNAKSLSFDQGDVTAQWTEIPGQGPASGTVATKEWVRKLISQ